eukprot:CAMPEP_0172505976 /NCGR_PEP_ID=MMETSP1066-20121228/190802_1 /TAXON_ID=671091 /ORGANISM="Coscinodiscus wailesii, Strain CCMP2513" /LENGTH=238 /DNA_ID=CAMNT_0013282795 /DNA_START=424 /DNA_END=1140 /DNA_ORIENTATION=+
MLESYEREHNKSHYDLLHQFNVIQQQQQQQNVLLPPKDEGTIKTKTMTVWIQTPVRKALMECPSLERIQLMAPVLARELREQIARVPREEHPTIHTSSYDTVQEWMCHLISVNYETIRRDVVSSSSSSSSYATTLDGLFSLLTLSRNTFGSSVMASIYEELILEDEQFLRVNTAVTIWKKAMSERWMRIILRVWRFVTNETRWRNIVEKEHEERRISVLKECLTSFFEMVLVGAQECV